MSIQQKFSDNVKQHRGILKHLLIEREEIIDALHIALLSRKNVYLIGPGGEGKTKIAKDFSKLCSMKFFDQQFHSFTKVDDWEGIVDLNEFKQGRLIRKVANFAPGADILLADEIGRGGAVLSCMYRLLNEGTYMEDGVMKQAPVELVFAGSNSMLPTEHDALFDRFPFFFECKKVSNENLLEILMDDDKEVILPENEKITKVMVHEARLEMLKVKLSKDIAMMIVDINAKLEEEGIHISTRLNRWSRTILQSSAYCEGRQEVIDEDVWVLRNVYARTLKQKPIVAKILRSICNQELDLMLLTFDQLDAYFNKWEQNACPRMLDGGDCAESAKELLKAIESVKPKDINKAEHSRLVLQGKAKVAAISASALAKRRQGVKE